MWYGEGKPDLSNEAMPDCLLAYQHYTARAQVCQKDQPRKNWFCLIYGQALRVRLVSNPGYKKNKNMFN
jgi:hypothetical protein